MVILGILALMTSHEYLPSFSPMFSKNSSLGIWEEVLQMDEKARVSVFLVYTTVFWQEWYRACSWNHLLRRLVDLCTCRRRDGVKKSIPQTDGKAHSCVFIFNSQARVLLTRLYLLPSDRWTFKRWKPFPSFLCLDFTGLLMSLLVIILYIWLVVFSIYYYIFLKFQSYWQTLIKIQ